MYIRPTVVYDTWIEMSLKVHDNKKNKKFAFQKKVKNEF